MFRTLAKRLRGEPRAWSAPATIEALDRTPVGRELAQRVADRLASGARPMLNRHRDYCGHGLVLRDGMVALVANHDGRLHDLLSWTDPSAFVGWLSVQSDYSLSGADAREPALHTTDRFGLNNQRITRARLHAYVAEAAE